MFRVGPYEEKDRAALEAIYRKCRSEADWLPAAARDRCDFAGDTMGEVLYVAVGAGDDAVGFVSAWEPDGFIHHLYVRDGLKGKGIGTQLLAAIGSRLPRPWRLKCVRANQAALGFYLAQGWLEVASGSGADGPYALLENA